MIRYAYRYLLLIGVLCAPVPAEAQRGPENLKDLQAEQHLAKAGVKSDDTSLLALLRGLPVGDADPAVIKRLIRQLGSDQFEKREEASQRLVAAGYYQAYAHLMEACDDKDKEIAARAAQCLTRILQRQGLLYASFCLLESRKSIPGLRILVQADSLDVRKLAVMSLEHLGASSVAAIPELMQALAHPNNELAQMAEGALASIGPPVVKPILRALDDPRPEFRAGAVRVLFLLNLYERLPKDDTEVLPRLLCSFRKEDAVVRRVVPLALGKFAQQGNEKALQALIEALKDRDSAPEQGDTVATAAAWALREIGPKAAAAIPALLEATRNPNERLAVAATQALGSVGKGNRKVVPLLIRLLTDNDRPSLRTHAAAALGQVGPEAKESVAILFQALKEEDLRGNCMYALVNIAPDDKAVIDALISQLVDSKTLDERFQAAIWLRQCGPHARRALPALRRAAAEGNFQAEMAIREIER